ncbi:MAG: hypothetical protein ACLTCQ_24485 [Enterocloster bolteae]
MDPSSSLEFQIPFSDVPQLYAFSEEDIHICLKGSEGVEKRAEQSKKIFRLEEVYETHRDIVYRLKNEIRDYSREEYNKIFCENYTDLFGGYDRFIEVLHPFLAEDEKNTPLTKMKKDIYFLPEGELCCFILTHLEKLKAAISEYFSGNEGYCNYYILSQEGEYMKWDK